MDVWLMNGTGFMVNDAEYQDYLKIANLKEPKLVSFHLIFGFFLTNMSRDYPVEITGQSMVLAQIIKEI